jgi:hypothetical protein
MNAEFRVKPLEVRMNSVLGNGEPGGNLLLGGALEEGLENIQLALRQLQGLGDRSPLRVGEG